MILNRKKIKLLWVYCFMLIGLMSSAEAIAENTSTSEVTLPIKLNVLNFDSKLNSFLLSGDFSNTLEKPLLAWRGEIRLKSTDTDEVVSIFYEYQARRYIGPGEWGVWSFWLDYKADVPEHDTLKKFSVDKVTTELQLIRALYSDKTQQAF